MEWYEKTQSNQEKPSLYLLSLTPTSEIIHLDRGFLACVIWTWTGADNASIEYTYDNNKFVSDGLAYWATWDKGLTTAGVPLASYFPIAPTAIRGVGNTLGQVIRVHGRA